MSLLKDPLFLTGSALLAIALGRTAMIIVGAVYVILTLAPFLK